MSRGGRGRGRGGGGRKGPLPPELDFDDDDDISLAPTEKKPQALFPVPQTVLTGALSKLLQDIDLPVPRPPTSRELAAVSRYLSFRTRTRNGPYFATLDPSSIADEKTGTTLKRAGFDPFNDQDKYTAKYHKKKRTLPDLKGSGREYALKYFPQELWPLLDPEKKSPLWLSADIDVTTNTPNRKSLKRKREVLVLEDDEEGEDASAKIADEEGNDTDDSDPLLSGSRRARTAKAAKKKRRRRETESREKRGLDAEDDFGPTKKKARSLIESIRAKERKRQKQGSGGGGESDEDEDDDDDDVPDPQENNGADGDEEAGDDDDDDDDEPVDSEFEESDDGEADDYNAENYFDGGEGDDEDGFAYGGGGGDEGGEF
ncbi:hypothetical protein AYO20_03001 [Fonsecaea nubica]|uniref:DNA-directed RNA polymerase III subunit n=1 Tax=Fonsecaea nubica TaxID=856822 RepID=A0A178D8Z1_9EURO|nr:hypothetical protein AYO20_03001 [Fonsecaea nubica]OAL37824.1 hypothetical protein AYO20_03001 [Fonsecaea nubica]